MLVNRVTGNNRSELISSVLDYRESEKRTFNILILGEDNVLRLSNSEHRGVVIDTDSEETLARDINKYADKNKGTCIYYDKCDVYKPKALEDLKVLTDLLHVYEVVYFVAKDDVYTIQRFYAELIVSEVTKGKYVFILTEV